MLSFQAFRRNSKMSTIINQKDLLSHTATINLYHNSIVTNHINTTNSTNNKIFVNNRIILTLYKTNSLIKIKRTYKNVITIIAFDFRIINLLNIFKNTIQLINSIREKPIKHLIKLLENYR